MKCVCSLLTIILLTIFCVIQVTTADKDVTYKTLDEDLHLYRTTQSGDVSDAASGVEHHSHRHSTTQPSDVSDTQSSDGSDTQPSDISDSQPSDVGDVVSGIEQEFVQWERALLDGFANHSVCQVLAVDPLTEENVNMLLNKSPKLIEFTLSVQNLTLNPLSHNSTWGYKSHTWSLVASNHGLTILSLAFNYGVLSLMTLNYGVEHMSVEIRDVPRGCLGQQNETARINTVLDLVLRRFNPQNEMVNRDTSTKSACFQIIRVHSGQAQVVDRCCYKKCSTCEETVCEYSLPNYWLQLLDILLSGLMIVVFVFGPCITPNWMYDINLESVEYAVKLKEPLYKKMCIWRSDSSPNVLYKHHLDLRNVKGFNCSKKLISGLPSGRIIPIKLSQFDIIVNYRKLLSENHVPVSITECISRALILCKIRELEPFEDCCESSMLGCVRKGPQHPWSSLCILVGKLMLVVIMPFAYYIRVGVYYTFEYQEVLDRHAAAAVVDLPLVYNYRPLQYFTPIHPLFLAAYTVYFATGFTLAYLSSRRTNTPFQKILIGSFADLKSLSMLKALGVVVKNILWPFTKFGVFGCVLGVVYWPVVLPISLIAWAVYSLPLVFITCRILIYTLLLIHEDEEDEKKEKSNKGIKLFEMEQMMKKIRKSRIRKNDICDRIFGASLKKMVLYFGASFIHLLAIYATMLMLSEVFGFLAEVLCFTMMGLIINASKVLKYGALIFLVIIYSYDTYNNVGKKYLKLNKSLFSEIKFRMGKDIDDFTSLPSHLQGCRGFKAAEASQQADYESTDDISQIEPFHWDINDLILFVDNEDNPRIPSKLFEEVCEIQTAGSPGPVYKSLLEATGKFLVIILFIVFVFMVVMSFGEEYKVSSTNQMLATLAGGFIPLFFRRVLKPDGASIETGLVSFKSKLEEIIQNFCQTWPMFDFQFTIEEEPNDDEEDETDGGKEKDKSRDKKCGKDKERRKSVCTKNTVDIMGCGGNARGQPAFFRMLSAERQKAEEMEMEDADGQFVDILIRATEDEEWVMEWSSYEDFNETLSVSDNHTEPGVEKSRKEVRIQD